MTASGFIEADPDETRLAVDTDEPEPFDREVFEPFVAAMLALSSKSREPARSTLALLVQLLRADRLPKSGRDWLADRLQQIADGADADAVMLPKRRKTPAVSCMEALAAVERERGALAIAYGDMAGVYAHAARRLPGKMSGATVQKGASRARGRVRQVFQDCVARGDRPEKVVTWIAAALRLPVDTVEMLIKPPGGR